MKKILTMLLIVNCVAMFSLEIGGINIPDSISYEDNNLTLKGAGLRKKFIIKVYAGALYVAENYENAPKIIEADQPMVISMHFLYRKVEPEQLIEAWEEGFEATNYSERDKINKFNELFTEPALKGDVYKICYTANTGTTVFINEKKIGNVQGYNFKKAVFSIWLSENTNLKKLRKAMLGE